MAHDPKVPISRRDAFQALLGLAVLSPLGAVLVSDGSLGGKRANMPPCQHDGCGKSQGGESCDCADCGCWSICRCKCHCTCTCSGCAACTCADCLCNCDCNDELYTQDLDTGLDTSAANWDDHQDYFGDYESLTNGSSTSNSRDLYAPESYEPYFGDVSWVLDRNNWITVTVGKGASGGNTFSYA